MRRGVLVLAVIAALALPAVAEAHGPTVSVGRFSASSLRPLSPLLVEAGVEADIDQTGPSLRLAVPAGHALLVLGYIREPFLRFDESGVSVNATSPTASTLGILAEDARSGGGEQTTRWLPLASGRSYSWRDRRIQPPVTTVTPVNWSIPIRIDGHATIVRGYIHTLPRAVFWPWLLIPVGLALGTLALRGRLSTSGRRLLCEAGVVLAIIATVLTVVGFTATATSSASQRHVTLAALCILTGLATVAYALAPRARPGVRGSAAILALLVAIDSLPALWRPIVVSAWPPSLARALIVVALSAPLVMLASTRRPRSAFVASRSTQSHRRNQPRARPRR